MVAPNTLLANGVPIPDAPWAEYNSKQGTASGAANFSYEGGNQAVITYEVNWSDCATVIQDLLGVNQIVHAPPGSQVKWQISRTPPAKHPQFPWLYASKCSVAPLPGKPQKIVGASGAFTSSYKFALIVTTFTQPKFRVLDDNTLDKLYPPVATVRQEQNRFVEYVPQIATEVASREGGSAQSNFQWAEGPLHTGVTATQIFNSPVAQAFAKADLILVQRRVPLYGGILSSASSWYKADNIEAFLGQVTAIAFLGRPSQTIRFAGYRITPIECPISPTVMLAGVTNQEGMPSLVADVEYAFSYWDPPPFAATRGHNLAPIPGDTAGRWAALNPGSAAGGAAVPANIGDVGIYKLGDVSTLFLPPG